MDELELLSAKQLASLLKVSLPCVYRWAEKGILPSYKLEGVVRFRCDDVFDWLQKRKRVGQKMVSGKENP